MFKDYKGLDIGASKVVAVIPVSDGGTALEIHNWRLDVTGTLDSTFRLMPLVPPALYVGSHPLFTGAIWAMKWAIFDGSEPELLILGRRADGTLGDVWRYTPWTRDESVRGQTGWNSAGTSVTVSSTGSQQFPPQMEIVGARIFFTFCDGGPVRCWDRTGVWEVGYTQRPGSPGVDGPMRDATGPNHGGLSVRGRIGNTEPDWTDSAGTVMGGIDDSEHAYGVVYESWLGGYSAASTESGLCTIRRDLAPPTVGLPPVPFDLESMRRRFRYMNVAPGPVGTVARIMLRTANRKRLGPTDTGALRFLRRIPDNVSTEAFDDCPDGELGPPWQPRESFPTGVTLLRHWGGSMWYVRGHRAWWSEQEDSGPILDSIMANHYMDIHPKSGDATCLLPFRINGGDSAGAMLVGKRDAVCYIAGQYPLWGNDVLHEGCGIEGPELAQALPDGSVVWYGSRTFWRMVAGEAPRDIGDPIRKYLRRINGLMARHGVSWVDVSEGEAVFALPYRGSATNDFQFVWDYRLLGWRTRQDVEISAAVALTGADIVLAAGLYDSRRDLWAMNRGYPGFVVTQPVSTYTSGWMSFSAGPQIHGSYNLNDLICICEERGSSTFQPWTSKDWNADTQSTYPMEPCHHPDNENIPYYGTAEYGIAVWRERRFHQLRFPVAEESGVVFVSGIRVQAPMGLVLISAYGPNVALPGGRTPQSR
ncbi:MAG: hypothetical protein WC869_08125 [Phycisphaerae bacterium]|jgi:hypothetical protein